MTSRKSRLASLVRRQSNGELFDTLEGGPVTLDFVAGGETGGRGGTASCIDADAPAEPRNGMTTARCVANADLMTDAELDALLPVAVRRVSRVYWTSVAVARRAAQILQAYGVRRVLDIGSGVGKFCIVAAARAPRLEFAGVEHRPGLVTIARSLAAEVGIANATFSVGDATQMPWKGFDAFYVFNSFAENDFPADEQFDQTVELSHARHIAEAKRMARRLAAAPVGSVVLTHHGLSGPIPGSYELLHAEAAGAGWLRVWRKGAAPAPDRCWLEQGCEVSSWSSRRPSDRDDPSEGSPRDPHPRVAQPASGTR